MTRSVAGCGWPIEEGLAPTIVSARSSVAITRVCSAFSSAPAIAAAICTAVFWPRRGGASVIAIATSAPTTPRTVDWRFTTENARITLKRLYPAHDD